MRLAFEPRRDRWACRPWRQAIAPCVNLAPRTQGFHAVAPRRMPPCHELQDRLVSAQN